MSFACDAVHDSDYVVECSCLGHGNIAVPKKSDGVFVSTYDAVYQVVAADISDKCNSACLDVLVLPWSQCDLVAKMYHERVHAVPLDCQGHCLSLRNQSPDFLHHHGLVLYNCLCHSLFR